MSLSTSTSDGLEIFRIIWAGRRTVFYAVLVTVLIGTGFAFIATPFYTAEVTLIANETEAGMDLPMGVSGLASLAGIQIGSSGDTTELVATLRSRVVVEAMIIEKDLMPILFADEWDANLKQWKSDQAEDQPDLREGVELFVEDIRLISEDTATGLIKLEVYWSDPVLAAEWAGSLVSTANERLRERDLAASSRKLIYLNEQLEKASLVELRLVLSSLIESEIQTAMIANAETEYAFKTIDPPRVPFEHSFPDRPLVVFASLLLGLASGMLLVFLRSLTAEQISS